MKIDPFDLKKSSRDRAIALHKEARIQYIETTPRTGDIQRRCYCEIRFRDRVWCGAAITNPADEYSKYKGWMLASARAASAVAHELKFPVRAYVSLIKLNTRHQAIREGIIQPTPWELKRYSRAEGSLK